MGPLVDVEGGADAVAGAVAIVEPHAPERRARQDVQRQPRGPLGEDRRVERDVALHTALFAHIVHDFEPADECSVPCGGALAVTAVVDHSRGAQTRIPIKFSRLKN